MSRILFFTKYTYSGPSSRYRTYQYSDFFKKKYDCYIYPFFNESYIKSLFAGKHQPIFYLIWYYVRRIYHVLFSTKRKDVLFIEYELLPYFPAWLELYLKLRGVKYVVDFDDAIFHNYDNSTSKLVKFVLKNKVTKVIKRAAHVITGSPYLTSFALSYNSNVSEIPTSITMEKYSNALKGKYTESSDKQNFVVGWIGSKTTSKNLLLIRDALFLFCQKHPNVVLTFVGVDPHVASILQVTPVQWTEQTELDLIKSFTVGIMPLEGTLFDKGKCGFKLIQYMALGKPTISTPLEANVKINRTGKNLHASTTEEWLQMLERVYQNSKDFEEVGKQNIEVVSSYYSVEKNYVKYWDIFDSLIVV